MEAYEHLENNEAVLEAFGYWPSFHDGEIHKFILDRTNQTYEGYYSPCVEFIIHGWEMTSDVNKQGYYKLQKHHLVHFRFEGVYEVDLDGFNHQNAITSLDFEVLSKNDKGQMPLSVVINPAWGLGGEFKALKGQVLSVEPCDSKGTKS